MTMEFISGRGLFMKQVLMVVLALLLASSVASAESSKFIYRASIGKDGVQRVDITAGSYFFKPGIIIVKVNVPVKLRVRKEPGIVPHDIVLHAPEAGIDFKESLGEEAKDIRFTPTRVGNYKFYCNKKLLFFPSHREEGMEGTLEVVK
jgi:plastocyanin domain-containing protein